MTLLQMCYYMFQPRKEYIHLYPVFRTFQVGMHPSNQFRDSLQAVLHRPKACSDQTLDSPTNPKHMPCMRELWSANKFRPNTKCTRSRESLLLVTYTHRYS